MPLYEILHRWSGELLFSLESGSLKLCVEAAIRCKANLSKANLSWADLSEANLSKANLSWANLSKANLRPIRDDLWAVLSGAPAEVAGLRQALIEGRVDGSTYTGACACLVGTLANVRGCGIDDLPIIRKNSARPIERWFLNIRPGHTAENSAVANIALEWIDLWLHNMRAVFGPAPMEARP